MRLPIHPSEGGTVSTVKDRAAGRVAAWLGIAVQDGHEQLVMPLAIPTERLPQTALMVKPHFS